VDLFRKIRGVVEAMPDVDLGEDGRGKKIEVSCHMLARAIAAYFPVECADGYFTPNQWPHSWLLTSRGNLIDVYPWAAVGGPVLLVGRALCPWRGLFRAAELDVVYEAGFSENVLKVTEAVRAAMQTLNLEMELSV
jgi:hypothetical protein